MTRDGTVGRSDATEPNLAFHRDIDPVRMNEDSVRAPHQGQQSTRTAPTGRTHDCKRLLRCTPNDLLPGGGHPHMKRREFITLIGGAVLTTPFAATAQRSTEVRRVGVLANEAWPPLEGLRDGMRGLGYVEKQSLQFEYRFAEGRSERYPALAAELVRLPADAIVAWGTPASLAAKQATGTVPIVMISGDPIAVGLVPGLAYP